MCFWHLPVDRRHWAVRVLQVNFPCCLARTFVTSKASHSTPCCRSSCRQRSTSTNTGWVLLRPGFACKAFFSFFLCTVCGILFPVHCVRHCLACWSASAVAFAEPSGQSLTPRSPGIVNSIVIAYETFYLILYFWNCIKLSNKIFTAGSAKKEMAKTATEMLLI